MPYTLSKSADPLKIAEQQYTTAAEIKFTAFTSCIGVVAKKGSSLTAVHLVLKAADESIFDDAAATEVLKKLPESYDKVTIIGCVDIWRNPANSVQGAYNKLVGGISSLTTVQQYSFASGTYGATIEGQDIDITY